MKRIAVSVLAMILCFGMLLSFAGCGDKEETFTPPENYVSVVKVTINPTVNLYLDAEKTILAVEYVNADAKESYEKIEKDLVGAPLEKGVTLVVETAAADGYLAENKQVSVDVVEVKDVAADEIAAVAENGVKAAVENKKLDVTVNVLANGAAVTTANTTAATTTAATTVATTVKTTTAKPTTVKPTTAKPTTVKPTTAAPKATLLMETKYVIVYPTVDDMIERRVLTFHADGVYGCGMAPFSLEKFEDDAESIVYNGKTYYLCGGAGGPGDYTVSGDTISLDGGDVVLTVNAQGNLTVKSSTWDNVKAGDVFTKQ